MQDAARKSRSARRSTLLGLLARASHPHRSCSRAAVSVSEFLLEALHVGFDSLPPCFKLLPERVLGRLFAILDNDRNDLLGSFDVDRRDLRFISFGLGRSPVDELRPEIVFYAEEIS